MDSTLNCMLVLTPADVQKILALEKPSTTKRDREECEEPEAKHARVESDSDSTLENESQSEGSESDEDVEYDDEEDESTENDDDNSSSESGSDEDSEACRQTIRAGDILERKLKIQGLRYEVDLHNSQSAAAKQYFAHPFAPGYFLTLIIPSRMLHFTENKLPRTSGGLTNHLATLLEKRAKLFDVVPKLVGRTVVPVIYHEIRHCNY